MSSILINIITMHGWEGNMGIFQLTLKGFVKGGDHSVIESPYCPTIGTIDPLQVLIMKNMHATFSS